MKTDEIQAAASAAAGSQSANARRLIGTTGGTGRSASVLRFGATGRWAASVVRWRRAAAVASSTLDSDNAAATGSLAGWLRWDFGTVRVVLAAVLLVAAALKSEQLWETSPQPFASPTFALILFEFAFAAWLLAGCRASPGGWRSAASPPSLSSPWENSSKVNPTAAASGPRAPRRCLLSWSISRR